MARCSRCGKAIRWLKTTEGKSLPVELGEYPVADDYSKSGILAVWPDGSTGYGRIVSENDTSGYAYCRISHFKFCGRVDNGHDTSV